MICLGRHPLQNPHYINPEIGKLPKSAVDSIPLVLFIPPPPDSKESKEEGDDVDAEKQQQKGSTEVLSSTTSATLDGGDLEHSYPPKPPPPVAKRRFTFMRSRSSKLDAEQGANDAASGNTRVSSGDAWEDSWERGSLEYPFVRLAGNRAVCAVCLMDFEAPKKRVAKNVIRGWSTKARASRRDASATTTTKGKDEKEKGKKRASKGKGKGSDFGAGAEVQPEDGDKEAADIASPEHEHDITEEQERDGDDIQEVPVRPSSTARAESGASAALHLEDAGEGPQPLRLLPCGHVFHVSNCLQFIPLPPVDEELNN